MVFRPTSDDAELMEENHEDADRADIAHAEEIESEEASSQCAAVGELVLNHASRHAPSDEQAGEEAANGQEYLSGNEVEHVEQWTAEDLKPVTAAEG